MSAKPKAVEVRKCRLCSCTDTDCRQCIFLDGRRCFWTEPDLCSSCAAASGEGLVRKEVFRQLVSEGWTEEHDDRHEKGELLLAAISYAGAVAWPDENPEKGKPRPCDDWPWARKWWKPSDEPIRNLVKAAALVIAEIARRRRLEETRWTLTAKGRGVMKGGAS